MFPYKGTSGRIGCLTFAGVMKNEKDISSDFLRATGENIRKKRKERKLSLEKLGLEVGLTRMQVHRIENGYNITLTTLLKLSLALNVRPEDLVKFDYKGRKADLERLVENSKGNKKRLRK